MDTEISAGGIVFRESQGQVEFLLMRDRFGVWTFPKGHVEPGETPLQTALREVAEEVGLQGLELVAPLGQTRYRFARRGTQQRKVVHWFLLRARPGARPEARDKAMAVGWIGGEEVLNAAGYSNLRPLLRKALELAAARRGQKNSPAEGRPSPGC